MPLQISIGNIVGNRDGGKITPPVYHVSEWRTTSANETITLPYVFDGTYNGIIDWGDGSTSLNSYANRSHTYTTAGYYTITINGKIRGFRFNNTGDKNKIYRIFSWGSKFDLGTGGSYFFGCSNLNLSQVSDKLILFRIGVSSNPTSLQNCFRDCTSLTTINRITEWNTSHITNMISMFQNTTNFNQNLGNLNVSSVTAMNNFLANKTFLNFSAANYDALLIGWASRPVQPNINIDFGTIKRTSASTSAKSVLTSSPNNWTIVDGGL